MNGGRLGGRGWLLLASASAVCIGTMACGGRSHERQNGVGGQSDPAGRGGSAGSSGRGIVEPSPATGSGAPSSLGGAGAGPIDGAGASANAGDTHAGEGGADTGGAGEAGAGQGGAGESGAGGDGPGIEEIEAACNRRCSNTPVVCFDGAERSDCYYHCVKEAADELRCAREYIAHTDCLASHLDAGASCEIDVGLCNGDGCTESARQHCTRSAEAFSSCRSRCAPSELTSSPSSCSLVRHCEPTFQTDCLLVDDGSGRSYWSCVCYYDGQYLDGFNWSVDVGNPCYVLDCGYR